MGQTPGISALINQWKKDRRVGTCITVAVMFVSALIQSHALQAFIRSAGIISGGSTDVAMLMERLGELKGLSTPIQVTTFLLNIPVAILCCKGTSIRFTIFSLVQVLLNSIFLQIFNFSPIFTDEVLNVISGDVIFGSAIIIALRGNAPTGSMDSIALFVFNRTGLSIRSYVFFGNAVMYYFYDAIFGWEHAGCSTIFQLISTRTILVLHHRYELVILQTTIVKGQEVVDAYVSHFRHGMPCAEAMGGYSKKKMYLLNTAISAYEVSNAIHIVQEVGEHIIINVLKAQQFVGRLYRAPLEQNWE